MRFYSFTHFMLSPIQQGIQTAHVVHQTFVDTTNDLAKEMLWDWAKDHKTIIVLNGGNTYDLSCLRVRVAQLCSYMGLPHSAFYEDQQSLNGTITAVGCVVPESIYQLSATIGNDENGSTPEQLGYIQAEIELAELLAAHSLAR